MCLSLHLPKYTNLPIGAVPMNEVRNFRLHETGK